MSTSKAPPAAHNVPVTRPNAEALPPAPAKTMCDRYPDVLVYAPFVPEEWMRARLHELNALAATVLTDSREVLAPGCRFHLQTDPAEIRNLLFLPKYAVVATVSPDDNNNEEKTKQRLDAELRHVPRFARRWLHFSLSDFARAQESSLLSAQEEEKRRLTAMGARIQTCYLQQAVQLDRAVQRPVVSMFTTTYRTGTRIRRAFQSLRRQHLVDWEWVIVDDSPDEGEHFRLLCTQLLVGDHRVRLYRRNGNNGSIGDVKNEAIGLCRGRYLMELDHDDELTPTCLADCAAVFQRDPAVGFVYTDFANLHEDTMTPFRYGEGYGLGIAGYYCRHILSADPRVSQAGAEADKAFRDGATWFSPQYVSVTPQVSPVTITHLVAMPNHPRMWRRTAMEHMGSYPEFLPICDDQEIVMRTQACGVKMVKLHTMGYLQYMNLPSNGSNFSGIRTQEICRMGSTGPLYKLFQEVHPSQDALFMEADCDPDMKFRGKFGYYHGWDRDEPPKYYNALEHPDGEAVVVYLGMAAVVAHAAQFLEDLFGTSTATSLTAAPKNEDSAPLGSSFSDVPLQCSPPLTYATPVHGSTELCDSVTEDQARRRRRVVYVLSGDQKDMEVLHAVTAWLRAARPECTQEDLCMVRAYGFDLADPAQRGLFRSDWSDEKCLRQYARHMYAVDATFVVAPPDNAGGGSSTRKRKAETEEAESGSSSSSSTKKQTTLSSAMTTRAMRLRSSGILGGVIGRNNTILPVDFDPPSGGGVVNATKATVDASSRLAVVQHFASLSAHTHYLEIGVETGALFNELRGALTKTGVDPAPSRQFRVKEEERAFSRFFELTSDAYFLDADNAARDVTVAFVDGMHLADYVARDIEYASEAILATLRRNRITNNRNARSGAKQLPEIGWLLLDDVVPANEAEQKRTPRSPYYDRGVLKYGAFGWTGDVWKAVAVILRKYPLVHHELFENPEVYRGVLALRLEPHHEVMRLSSRELAAAMSLEYATDFDAYLANDLRAK